MTKQATYVEVTGGFVPARIEQDKGRKPISDTVFAEREDAVRSAESILLEQAESITATKAEYGKYVAIATLLMIGSGAIHLYIWPL